MLSLPTSGAQAVTHCTKMAGKKLEKDAARLLYGSLRFPAAPADVKKSIPM